VTAHRRLTASGLGLAARCAAAFALPAVEHEETGAMRAGTGRHAYLSGVAHAIGAGSGTHPEGLALAREEALADIPADAPWRSTCEAIDLDALFAELAVGAAPVTFVEADLAHVWDPATDSAQALGVAAHRAYADGDGLVGTLDWLVHHEGGGFTVLDFKGTMRATAARENLQLALYALQVARARGVDAIGVALCYIDEEGGLTWDRATLDAWDLDAAAARLAGIHRAVGEARAALATPAALPMRTGSHCGDCPAARVCPAMVALVRELVIDGAPAVEPLAILTDVEAGVAWERLELLENALANTRRALRARAEIRGLPLPGGRQLVPVETVRRSLILPRAEDLLRGRFGDQVDAVIDRSITAESVARLARQLAPGKGQKKVVDALWGDLAAAGAVKTSSFVQLRERAARKSAGGAEEGAEP